jgi:N-acetylneuraminic acid mutarotase
LETKVFETFYLYDSKDFDEPFLIFNNCASIIIKNHLGFLFGGEDPSDKDRSSKRAFCFNLEKKTKDSKIVVYELDEMNYSRQEFTLTAINNFVYLISGYDSNQLKEKRVIPKCEKFDLKTKKFYEIRDINYPRQWACCLNMNNTHIYTFNGMNPKYLNTYVEKIEKFIINVNDWVVLKYSLLDNVDYVPSMKSTCFKINENEIVIFGGVREHEILTDYFVFDVKKLVIVKKSEKPIMKKTDEFQNQNDIILLGNKHYFYSGTYVNKIYEVKTIGTTNILTLDILKKEEGNL